MFRLTRLTYYNSLQIVKSYFHISSSTLKNFNAVQIANLSRKFLKKEVIIKLSLEPPLAKKVPVSSNPKRKKKPSLVVGRKLIKLDKIFLEKITDLLSTSEYGAEILENRIEITQVQLQIGYSAIHVFWASSNISLDEKINNLFIKIAPLLRHELKQLNVFGCVPPLLFIKDVSRDRMMEIDRKLAIADFGEDYVPSLSTHYIVANHVLHKKLKDDVWKTVNQMSKEVTDNECSIDELDQNIPKLQQNVYGLHRDRIINSVMLKMRSSKAEHRRPKEESDMEHQRSFISPAIVKSTSFSQVEGVRTSDIRAWANQFRKTKAKMLKENLIEELKEDLDDHYEELIDDARDYIDYDTYEDGLDEYEENSLDR